MNHTGVIEEPVWFIFLFKRACFLDFVKLVKPPF